MKRALPLWFVLITLRSLSAQELPAAGPLPEASESGIEYHSVAEALAALRARHDVTVSTEHGWEIITDKKNLTLWSFAPDSYPAHPAVVKRTVRTGAAGGSEVNMSVHCEASKEACDQLVREFDAMNRRLPRPGTPGPVSSRRVSNALYELTVTLQNTTDVFAAQGLLIPEARKLCGGQPFQFGHYEFRANEMLSEAPGSPKSPSPSLTLRQEVACGPNAATLNSHTSYEWSPSETDSQLVAARTQEYLAEKDKGEVALAYGQFSDGMKASVGFDTWSKGVADFNSKAGSVESRKVLKVSWVKDPPGVEPGFYAAVDYTGRFHNVGHECGYVAWYREASGQLTIAREEQGYIDRESEAGMTEEALRNMLAKIGCVGGQPSSERP